MFRIVAVIVLLVGVASAAEVGSFFGQVDIRSIPRRKGENEFFKGRVVAYHGGNTQKEAIGASTLIAADGSFSLHNLPLGFYALVVEAQNVRFPVYSLQVLKTNGGVRVQLQNNEAQPFPMQGGSSASPAQLRPLALHDYFVPREEYSIMGIVKNPMVLMMLFTFGVMGLMQLMPKEEMRQQMKEMSEALESGKKVINQQR